MLRNLSAALIAAMMAISPSGCRQSSDLEGRPSAIVATVEGAGAGPLAGVDQGTIQLWLNAHSEVAKQIVTPCKQAGAKSQARWRLTTEGIVCAADAQVMFTMPTKLYKSF